MEQIVKVQISIFSSDGKAQVLVYGEDRQVLFEGNASKEIIQVMDGEYKKYFFAKVPKKPGYIELGDEAPEQDW